MIAGVVTFLFSFLLLDTFFSVISQPIQVRAVLGVLDSRGAKSSTDLLHWWLVRVFLFRWRLPLHYFRVTYHLGCMVCALPSCMQCDGCHCRCCCSLSSYSSSSSSS